MATNDDLEVTLGLLSDADHDAMEALLGGVLDDYKDGLVGRANIIAGLAQFIAAIDHDAYGEVVSWLRDGRTFIRNTSNRSTSQVG